MTTRYDIPKSILALLMSAVLIMGQLPLLFSSVAVADDVVPVPYIENCGPRLVVKNAAEGATFQWQISSDSGASYSKIDGATNNYYDIKESDEGKSIQVVVKVGDVSQTLDYMEGSDPAKVGKLVVFDISKGSVTFGSTCTGVLFGNDAASSLVHEITNVYVIKQSDPSMTGNTISFSGNLPDAPFDVTLCDVNMGEEPTNLNQDPGKSGSNTPTTGHISIPAKPSDGVKHVTLRLKGENIVRNITYYNGGDVNEPQAVHSSLKITDINGDGATSGSLYIPVKKTDEEIDSFVALKTNYNHWNAGIGGTDGSSLVQNLEIAGGSIQVLTTLGDNCTAIGAGGNGYCQMEISGGNVTAHCNGTGAAIGGGIGWNAKGGRSDVLISGGTVYAKNHGNLESGGDIVGGVAIGSGSSFVEEGTEGKVVITGGTVTASGTFGNGIGGGNSSSSKGGSADISISGGTVNASSIGGGNSKKGVGGDADVTISGDADVTIIGGIGGGDGDTLANEVRPDGGAATITVTGGRLACGGVIGGGAGGDTGNGGEATIKVSGGVLVAKSIGGGTGGNGGNGGAAEVSVSGGTILTGSIGGGNAGEGGQLGYATADISGGDISGQFLMAATGGSDSDPSCSFTMTGGTLRSLTEEEKAQHGSISYVKPNGGAVYMDDPKGEVSLSGGTVQGWSAVNGGAIYMTAGTFNLSGTGAIKNCYASGSGGAVYLGGGEVNVSGGEISGNTAENNGGGVAIENGNFRMTGGVVGSDNENKGNIAKNGMGGGIYVHADGQDVTVDVLSGSVSRNTASGSGGAFAVVGKEGGTENISVTIGVNDAHFDGDGNEVLCEHGASTSTDCPVIQGNHTGTSGGAVYVAGGTKTQLNVYCLTESGNIETGGGNDDHQSTFMRMEGGKVLISTSDPEELENGSQTSTHGNISIAGNMYVTGGQVDLYGAMSNPSIAGVMTVDIEKSTGALDDDYFVDHRNSDGFYKLVYFENFKTRDPDTGIESVTGQYKAYTVASGSTLKIAGGIYEHPGYSIVGWNTHEDGEGGLHDFEPGRDPDNPTHGWYEVGKEYLFDGSPLGDLAIYADWDPNGYTVVFDPNSPDDKPYSGLMENQILRFNERQNLSKNEYACTGYIFQGWSVEADGEVAYSDQDSVINLTTKHGVVVTLYAKWIKCEHDDPNLFVYSVVDEGKTLRRDCSCGGYYETVALSAENVPYDMKEHPATIVYSSDSWKPTVLYSKSGDAEYDGLSQRNAGVYTASVKVGDVVIDDKGNKGDLVASVTYTIEKIDQPAPADPPDYEAYKDGEVWRLSAKAVTDSPYKELDKAGYDSKKQYQVVYYVGEEKRSTDWVDGAVTTNSEGVVVDSVIAATFDLPVALTNYYVHARYSSGTNYNASPSSESKGAYFFTGDVEVQINCGEGIVKPSLKRAGSSLDGPPEGITFDIIAEDGYYIPSSFSVDIETFDDDGLHEKQASLTGPDDDGAYAVSDIPGSCRIVITIPDAKRATLVESHVEAGRVFGALDGVGVVISRDSAYSICFDFESYDPAVYGESTPVLEFSVGLPKGAGLILVDKTRATWSYYYYVTFTDGVTEIPLCDFKKMGATQDRNGFAFAMPSAESSVKLQFVVDFSTAESTMTGAEFFMALDIAAKSGSGAESIEASAEIQLANVATFEISRGASTTEVNASEELLDLSYVASDGAASKWDGRATTLVLNPESTLPSDARLKCAINGLVITVYPNDLGKFVVPLSPLNPKSLQVQLLSDMVDGVSSVSLDADWMVNRSLAAASPLNGEKVAYLEDIELSIGRDARPSLEVECLDSSDTSTAYQRLMAVGDYLHAVVNWSHIPANCEMTLTLKVKSDSGEYVSTGLKRTIVHQGDSDKQCSFDIELLDSFKPNSNASSSCCLEITAMQDLVEIASDRYYFIIE